MLPLAALALAQRDGRFIAMTTLGISPIKVSPIFIASDYKFNFLRKNTSCGRIVSYPISGSDNCAYTITQTDGTGYTSGDLFPVGTTTVTATATNAVGTSSTSFDVIVTDNETPVVLTQGATVQLDANGQASITVAQINNGSTDNCGIASIVLKELENSILLILLSST